MGTVAARQPIGLNQLSGYPGQAVPIPSNQFIATNATTPIPQGTVIVGQNLSAFNLTPSQIALQPAAPPSQNFQTQSVIVTAPPPAGSTAAVSNTFQASSQTANFQATSPLPPPPPQQVSFIPPPQPQISYVPVPQPQTSFIPPPQFQIGNPMASTPNIFGPGYTTTTTTTQFSSVGGAPQLGSIQPTGSRLGMKSAVGSHYDLFVNNMAPIPNAYPKGKFDIGKFVLRDNVEVFPEGLARELVTSELAGTIVPISQTQYVSKLNIQ